MDKFLYQLYEQFEQRLIEAILKVLNEKSSVDLKRETEEWNEWMDLQTAAKYLGVSANTFYNFRARGLKVAEIGSVKRVSKTELDKFMKKHSR